MLLPTLLQGNDSDSPPWGTEQEQTWISGSFDTAASLSHCIMLFVDTRHNRALSTTSVIYEADLWQVLVRSAEALPGSKPVSSYWILTCLQKFIYKTVFQFLIYQHSSVT